MGCYYGSQTVSKLFSLIIIQKCKAGDVLATAVSLLSCWNPWGATNCCFIIWLFFFFRRQEQMHWNSGERQKEIQRAEKQVSSQSNILTYDLGGAECWTWRSLCNHCRLHWYSYNVTNCKSRGKGTQSSFNPLYTWKYTNNVLSHCNSASRHFGPTWAKVSNVFFVFFYGGRKPERLEETHTNREATCELCTDSWPWWRLKHRPSLLSITNTTAYPAIMDVVVLDSNPGASGCEKAANPGQFVPFIIILYKKKTPQIFFSLVPRIVESTLSHECGALNMDVSFTPRQMYLLTE